MGDYPVRYWNTQSYTFRVPLKNVTYLPNDADVTNYTGAGALSMMLNGVSMYGSCCLLPFAQCHHGVARCHHGVARVSPWRRPVPPWRRPGVTMASPSVTMASPSGQPV